MQTRQTSPIVATVKALRTAGLKMTGVRMHSDGITFEVDGHTRTRRRRRRRGKVGRPPGKRKVPVVRK